MAKCYIKLCAFELLITIVAAVSSLFCTTILAQEMYTWRDSTGQFSVEASLVGFDNATGTVVLKKTDGTEVKVPLARLDSASQALVGDLSKSDNPESQGFPLLEFPDDIQLRGISFNKPAYERENSEPMHIRVASPSQGIVSIAYECKPDALNKIRTSQWYDMKQGVEVKCPFKLPSERFAVEAFSPDFKYLIARDEVSYRDPDRLSVWRVQGDSILLVRKFIPFSTAAFAVQDVVWCNSQYIFITSKFGPVVLVDTSSFRVVKEFPRGSIYAISPDRNTIAFMAEGAIAFYSLEDASPICCLTYDKSEATSKVNTSFGGDFSADGKRFASLYHDNLSIFDWKNGKLIKKIKLNRDLGQGFSLLPEVYWYDGSLVVLNNSMLVDVDAEKILQLYQGIPSHKSDYTYCGNWLLYIVEKSTSSPAILSAFRLPTPEESEALGVPMTELDVYADGMPIALDLQDCNIPSIEAEDIASQIAESNPTMAFVKLSTPTDLRLKITATPGPGRIAKPRVRTIHKREDLGFVEMITYSDRYEQVQVKQVYTVSIDLYHKDQLQWHYSRTFPSDRDFESTEGSPQAWYDRESTPKLSWFDVGAPARLRSDDYKQRVKIYRCVNGSLSLVKPRPIQMD